MEKLGVDIKFLLAQMVNFGIFFFIFKKFIAKPFISFMQNEEKKDKHTRAQQDEIQKNTQEMKKMESDWKKDMDTKSKQIVAQAKEGAETVQRKSILEDAKKEAEEVVLQAKKRMDEEKRMLEQSTQKKAADLSVVLVQTALKDYLNENMQQDITKRILSRLQN